MVEELIGKVIRIQKSSNKSQTGIEGKIIDEKMHTFLIKTEKGRKIILKRNAVFQIDGKKVIGNELEKRPYNK